VNSPVFPSWDEAEDARLHPVEIVDDISDEDSDVTAEDVREEVVILGDAVKPQQNEPQNFWGDVIIIYRCCCYCCCFCCCCCCCCCVVVVAVFCYCC